MGYAELFMIAVGLSMDAFAASVCKGLSLRRVTVGRAALVGGWFGGFQMLMPLIGYYLGSRFESKITRFDHWVAFALLAAIGVNMIREAMTDKDDSAACCAEKDASLAPRAMLGLAVATSIDALAVGVTFAFLQVDILPATALIGLTTFILSAAGVKIGHVFGVKYKTKAELTGGLILVLLGTKILLEHLGVIA